MIFEVDAHSAVPLFEQVAAAVRRHLADGRLAAGERLPSAKDVASALDINVHTVLRAYQLLRDEGLIELRRGRGAVVIAAEPAARLGHLVNQLRDEARKWGLTDEQLRRLVSPERDHPGGQRTPTLTQNQAPHLSPSGDLS